MRTKAKRTLLTADFSISSSLWCRKHQCAVGQLSLRKRTKCLSILCKTCLNVHGEDWYCKAYEFKILTLREDYA